METDILYLYFNASFYAITHIITIMKKIKFYNNLLNNMKQFR